MIFFLFSDNSQPNHFYYECIPYFNHYSQSNIVCTIVDFIPYAYSEAYAGKEKNNKVLWWEETHFY